VVSVAWPSGYRVRLRCERTKVRIKPRAVVFIMAVAAIYSLGHGLRTFAAVPRSTQLSILCVTLKWVSAHGLNNNNNGDDGYDTIRYEMLF